MNHSTILRLKALRQLLKSGGLDGFIVPRQDEFQGEYVCSYAERLKWLSGFSGSWGTGIVLAKRAALFVDGRYTSQAKAEVPSPAWLHKSLIDEPPVQWLRSQLKRGQKLGFDPMLTSVAEAKRLWATCQEVGAKLVPVSHNPIDALWREQPARPTAPIFGHPMTVAGRSGRQKIKDIQLALLKAKRDAVLITDPASVAWLFNLRGGDVPYTPVVLAYALVKAKGLPEIFVDAVRLPKGFDDAKTMAPNSFGRQLKALSGKCVQLDETSAPAFAAETLLKAKAQVIHAPDPCALPKACKNPVEQNGARAAQLRDGAALCRFLHWFSQEAPSGRLDETAAAAQLRKFRQETGKLFDLSFETIPAAGPNAALPHYHVPNTGGRRISLNEIFLIDSGGQYRDGTTDVTRTVIVGKAGSEMKDRFTRVLKGMIAVSASYFPQGTTGAHLDAFARRSLWAGGFEFDHGTGHGVGSFLSVHEGPQRISKTGHEVLRPGMIVSNEPGYYKPKHYGIRIENLLLVNKPQSVKGGEREMLSFETLTLAPIDRNLIDQTLLTREELHWLDGYHARVLREIGALVPKETRKWLAQACAPLP